MKKYSHIIFDLDGTLTDPGRGITNSVMYALGKFGIKAGRSELYKFIGPPLRESFRTYYGFDAAGAEEAVTFYREYFSVKGMFENELYTGIPELLDSLKKSGRKLYVATSKPAEYSIRILDHFRLKEYFDYVSGSNMDGTMSEKSSLIGRILSRISMAEYTETVMVGDRRYDIEGARYHGLDSVAVTYGYGELREIEDSLPTYIADTTGMLGSYLLG
jgi:phosphoglycolate phosphatase